MEKAAEINGGVPMIWLVNTKGLMHRVNLHTGRKSTIRDFSVA